MIEKSSRVLITGADGFVGWYVLGHLKEQGWSELHVTTFSNSDRLVEACGADHVHQVDLTNAEAVRTLLHNVKPDAILHFAAWASVGDSFEQAAKVMHLNTDIQLAMLEAIRHEASQARLLCIGSAHAYGRISDDLDARHVTEDFPFAPDNPYSVSKLTQEMLSRAYAAAYKLDVVFIRPFNQIGPGQRGEFAVASFAKQIVAIEQGEQEKLMVGNLDSIRDFTDVRDAAIAYRVLMQHGKSGETYNLGSGEGVRMQRVLDFLVHQASVAIPVEVDPERLRPSDVPVFVADASRLKALGWTPSYSLEQTLRDILMEERSQKTTKTE
jgi:GDP-4-dehydro-6-deoxy-D-mannose reductase